MTVENSVTAWDGVRGQRAVMVTTYRRDGRPVATPLGYGIDGDRLYFMTQPDSGKTKRLRHTPRVGVAASTLRGRVTGPAYDGIAVPISGPAARHAQRLITSSNRLAWKLLLRGPRRDLENWAVYEVRPASTAEQELSPTRPSDTSTTNESVTP